MYCQTGPVLVNDVMGVCSIALSNADRTSDKYVKNTVLNVKSVLNHV